jgi:adenylate cyclase
VNGPVDRRTEPIDEAPIPLSRILVCCEGMVPAVVATSAADGTPNVTFLSRVHVVDDERVALSNQFFSKTARNLAENPRASVVLIDPVEYRQFRLGLVYERTERRGLVFDRLREDVDLIAALSNMSEVFRLRAADIYRVLDLEEIPANADAPPPPHRRRERLPVELASERLGDLLERIARCGDVDSMVDTALRGLAELLGHEHSILTLWDDAAPRLYTIASRGYAEEGIGSEVLVGDGILGITAERCTAIRRGGVRQMQKYASRVRQAFDDHGVTGERSIPVPRLDLVDSQLAVPAMAFGQLVGVLAVESTEALAYDAIDQAHLIAVAAVLAHAIEAERSDVDAVPTSTHGPGTGSAPTVADGAGDVTHVRGYAADGSIFLDGEYLIRGVAGRALWSILCRHAGEGVTEFSNKELRLDPSLGLPAFRDNLDSRLLLLKRRLDERHAPMRIVKTGRGRFRLELDRPVRLEQRAADGSDDG